MSTEVGSAHVEVMARLNRASVQALRSQLTAAMSQAGQAAQASLGAVGSLVRGVGATGSAFGQAAAAASSFAQQALAATAKVGQSVGILSTRVGLLGFQFQILGAAITRYVTVPLAGAAVAVTAFGLKSASNLEKNAILWKSVTNGAAGYQKQFKQLIQIAIDSPVFDTDALTKYSAQLVSAGFAHQKVIPLMKSLGNLFLSQGVDVEKASLSLLALTQMYSKNKISGQELNVQLRNAMPGAMAVFKQAALNLGLKSVEALIDGIEEGTVTMDQFFDELTKIGQSRSVLQKAIEASGGLAASWQALKESLSTKIGLAFLDDNYRLKPEIATAFKDFAALAHALADIFVENVPKITARFKEFMDQLARLKLELERMPDEKLDKIKQVILVIAAAGPGLTIAGFAFTILSTGLGAIAASLTFIASPLGILIIGILALAAAGVWAYTKFEDFRKGVQGFVTEFKEGWEEDVKPAMDALMTKIREELMPALEDLARSLGFESWEELGKWLGEKIPQALVILINSINVTVTTISLAIGWIKAWVTALQIAGQWIDNTSARVDKFRTTALVGLAIYFGILADRTRETWNQMTGHISQSIDKTKASINAFRSHFIATWTSIADGMFAGANKIIDFLNRVIDQINKILPKPGITKLQRIGGVPDTGSRSQGVQQFATGGRVRGAGTGTSDSIPALLSNGEHVWTAAEVMALGGHQKMEMLRRLVREGTGPASRYLGYASGGGVGVPSVSALMSLVSKIGVPHSISSSFRSTNDYHGSGNAIDIVSDPAGMIQIASFLMRTVGSRLLELIHSGGGGFFVKNGQKVNSSFYASEIANHFSHVHVAATLSSLLGGIGGGFTPNGDVLSGVFEKIFSGVAGPFKGLLNGLGTGLGGQALKGVFGGALDGLKTKATGLLGFSSAGTVGGQLGSWMQTALNILGLPQSWLGPLHTLIQRESSGNPRTINTWDSNAAMGDPSRGLMQTIGATFSRYRLPSLSPDIYDPISNIVAGLRYIQARYGSIFNVQQANSALPPMGYDFGGPVPPGLNTIANMTGKPEFMLNPAQGAALTRRLDSDGRPIFVTVLVDGVEMLARVIVDDEQDDLARSLNAGGGI